MSINEQMKAGGQVIPINAAVSAYKQALDLYLKHPSIPTLIYLLDRAVESDIRFIELESVVGLLGYVDGDDAYYGYMGSRYFSKHHKDLYDVRKYRPYDSGAIEILPLIWKFVEKYESDDIWGTDRCIVGFEDYLWIHKDNTDSNQSNIDQASELKSFDELSEFGQLGYEIARAVSESEDAARKFTKIANEAGFKYIPSVAWISELIPKIPDLSSSLQDFSDYILSYFIDENTVEKSIIKIDKENAISLIKIFSYILLNRMLSSVVPQEVEIDFEENFLQTRLSHLSDFEKIENDGARAEYIIIIINLIMLAGKFGIKSVPNQIISQAELECVHLQNSQNESFDLLFMAALPNSALLQVLRAFNRYEGDRPDEYDLGPILRLANYGVKDALDEDLLDETLDRALYGLEEGLFDALRKVCERNVRSWVIPLSSVDEISGLDLEFWNSHEVLKNISNALFQGDIDGDSNKKFLLKTLDDIQHLTDDLEDDFHPAIFLRCFSNSVDFVEFKDENWTKFIWSLINAGQLNFASAVTTIYLLQYGAKRSFNIRFQLNLPELRRILQLLSSGRYFSIVQEAIQILKNNIVDLDPKIKGCLFYFLPLNSDINRISGFDDIELHKRSKNSILGRGVQFDNMDPAAVDHLVKGFALLHDPSLSKYNYTSEALFNYAQFLERELRSRIPLNDVGLMNELSVCGIEVYKNNNVYKLGSSQNSFSLGVLIRVIEVLPKLSENARRKMRKLGVISNHARAIEIIESLDSIRLLRNSIAHSGDSGFSNLPERVSPDNIEQALFGDLGLVNILNESA